jgi:hypothetical protein
MESATIIRTGIMYASLCIQLHASLLMGNGGASDKNFRVGVDDAQRPGVSFTLPAQGFSIDSVTLNLRDYTSEQDTPIIGFYTDDKGEPGTLIGSPLKNPFSSSSSDADFTFFPDGKLTLDPNETYWVLVTSASGSFWWNASGGDSSASPAPFGAASFDCYKIGLNYGEVYVEDKPVPSFTIRATAVPEPSQYAIIGLGILLYTLGRHKQLHAAVQRRLRDTFFSRPNSKCDPLS